MTILVTGAAGRIGNRIAEALLARGDAVTGFDLAPPRIAHARYRHVRGAFDDPAAAAEAVRGARAAAYRCADGLDRGPQARHVRGQRNRHVHHP
ncbi:NAD-dependent epimerase/dehydratase family protein [Falsiroseomonas sp. HW251]|uniref:NAD-dependent epimerase/dehydratase family protein n=1 Tax=Falsiroseomonas sp. HW251 TaxID=3390998 RepID=UPI003D319755